MQIVRRRWYASEEGSDTPLDRLLDAAEATVSLGVRELCCLLGVGGRNFQRAAQSLWKAGRIRISEEMLRQVVEGEGKAVLACQRQEQEHRLVSVTQGNHHKLRRQLRRDASCLRVRAASR